MVASLIATYEPKVYDSLGEIDVVDKLVSEEQIFAVGELILKFVLFRF